MMRKTETGPFRRMLVLGLAVAMLAGCTSTHLVPLTPQGIDTLAPGNLVLVTTRDGDEHRFGVVEVTPTTLIGENYRAEFAAIERIERREFSWPLTGCLVGGIVALVIYILSNMSFFPSGGP